MQAKLLGFMGVDFTNKDGEQIVGMNIFAAFKDENVHGLRTEKFFLKEGISLPEQVKINDTWRFPLITKEKSNLLQKCNVTFVGGRYSPSLTMTKEKERL